MLFGQFFENCGFAEPEQSHRDGLLEVWTKHSHNSTCNSVFVNKGFWFDERRTVCKKKGCCKVLDWKTGTIHVVWTFFAQETIRRNSAALLLFHEKRSKHMTLIGRIFSRCCLVDRRERTKFSWGAKTLNFCPQRTRAHVWYEYLFLKESSNAAGWDCGRREWEEKLPRRCDLNIRSTHAPTHGVMICGFLERYTKELIRFWRYGRSSAISACGLETCFSNETLEGTSACTS